MFRHTFVIFRQSSSLIKTNKNDKVVERDESESLMLRLFMVEQNTYFRFQDCKFVVLYEKGARFRSQTISVLNLAFGPIRSQIHSARFQDRSVRTVECRREEIKR